jgi:hypothetical protein
VAIAAGGTTGTFKVTGVTLGSATISASSAGYIADTANVLVVNLGAIALSEDLTVTLGQSAPLDVKLSTPAPAGGVTVALTSSNASLL